MTDCNCDHETSNVHLDTASSHLPRVATRRDILKWGTVAAGVMALGPLGGTIPIARAAPLQQKRLVIVNLFGGCDTLNMVAPTYLQSYYDRRPGIAITQQAGLDLNSGPGKTSDYVLQPTMTNIHQLWLDGDVAAVQRVGYPRANLSHFTSQDIFSLGVRDGFAELGRSRSGWIARFADLYAAHPLGAVSVGVGRPLDFVGGSSNPFLVDRLQNFRLKKGGSGFSQDTPEHLHRIGKARAAIARWSQPGISSEARVALGQAHDLSDQVLAAVQSYESTAAYDTGERLSRQLQDVARMVQYGFDTKLFFTGAGGYDTHGNQGAGDPAVGQGRQLRRLDVAIGAFADDMKAMGLWNDTAICIVTEFGRRNFENGSAGTDHGHGFCELVIGGKVKGGAYGPRLTDADVGDEDWLPYEVDFRSIYKEVLRDHMGVSPEPVFPEALEQSHDLNLI